MLRVGEGFLTLSVWCVPSKCMQHNTMHTSPCAHHMATAAVVLLGGVGPNLSSDLIAAMLLHSCLAPGGDLGCATG